VANVTPVRLNFGSVKVGRSKIKSFTITNRGANPLIGTVGNAANPYSVVEGVGAYELAKNRKRRVKVRFSPTIKGTAPAGNIQVATNDHDQAGWKRQEVGSATRSRGARPLA
jgi:hypothetical protein